MSRKKIKCGCKKDAVIIENKIYYCAPCYINKLIRVHKRYRYKPNNYSFKDITKGV